MESGFADDPKVQQMAEAYAADALDFARTNFRLTLDWSDASIGMIESMLDDFDRSRKGGQPSDNVIIAVSRMFGSYVGEVYRKNHGGTWGIVTLGGESFPGMRADDGNVFWPWGRVENRITNGREDNVLHYYQDIVRRKKS